MIIDRQMFKALRELKN